MAANIINWSELEDFGFYDLDLFHASLNPDGDVLHFDDPSLSAYDLFFEWHDDYTSVDVTDLITLKMVTFFVDGRTITTSNVTFDHSSVLIVGDNNYRTSNDDGANTIVGGSTGKRPHFRRHRLDAANSERKLARFGWGLSDLG